jgi:EthD domain
MSAKLIYLARRNPTLTAEEFPRRWRRHARLAASMPGILTEYRGGAYCHVQPGGDVLPGASAEYDGVATFGLNGVHSIPAVARGLVDNDVTACDERLVFSGLVRDFSIFCHETTFRDIAADAERSRGSFVVIRFVRAAAGVGPTPFTQRWLELGERTVNQPVLDRVLRRCFSNVVIAPGPPGYNFDAVSELWFDSLDDVAAARPELDALDAESSDFVDLPRSLTLLTTTIMDWRS